MRRIRIRSRVWRASVALALMLSSAGAERLAVPVAAGVCGPIDAEALPDPASPGDPAYSMLEDTQLVVAAPGLLANDNCVGSVLGLSKFSESGGTATVYATGRFTFNPVLNGYGAAGFDYSFISDDFGLSNKAHVTLNVIPVNDEPVISHDDLTCPSITIAEDGSYSSVTCFWSGAPGGLYEDSQTITGHARTDHPEYFDAGPALNILYSNALTPLTFTLKANANGTATIFLWVTDSGGTSNGGDNKSPELPITLTITPVADAPVANADSYSVAFNTPLNVSAGSGVLHNDVDVDGNGLTANAVMGPAHGVLLLQANGAFTYTPTAGYVGPDSFKYTAISGSKGDDATVSLTVNAAGATPVPTSTPTQSTGPGSTAPAPSASAGGSASPATGSPAPSAGTTDLPLGSGGELPSGLESTAPGVPGSTDATVGSGASAGASAGAGAAASPGQADPAGAGDSGDRVPLIVALVVALVALVAGAVGVARRRGPAAGTGL